jgi:subtilase family serine protease
MRCAIRPYLVQLEERLALTGNIAVTNALLVNANDRPLSSIRAGQCVYVEADFTTDDLPAKAAYRVGFTVNGLTMDTGYVTSGAGSRGTSSFDYYLGPFIATPGANQVTATVDPDRSVAETSYADNTMNFAFSARPSATESLSYTVSQIRSAYGINSIPDFGSATADGSGQTIAIIDDFNDPTVIADLDDFDRAMHLSTNSSPTLYQQYGPWSSFLTVYNQHGRNITAHVADSGTKSQGVPTVDPTGGWEGEETLDVQSAHAIAPGAKIDFIECSGRDGNKGLLKGTAMAKKLAGVSVVSMSWGFTETKGERADDSRIFVTPRGHRGVTFVTAAGDAGTVRGVNAGYPSFSPNVLSVGATQLTLNSNSYESETGWSFPTPRTLGYGGRSYSQTGPWTTRLGGFDGIYGSAAAGSGKKSSATWTTSLSSADLGYNNHTEVSATWVAGANHASDATYKIYNGTAATGTSLGTVTVNQRKAPVGTNDGGTQFQALGEFSAGSGILTVVVSAKNANGTVVAGAIGIAPAWASTGGQSEFEPEPEYQRRVENSGYRTAPDVAFDGSDYSGLTLYEDGQFFFDGFGSSAGSPTWAGLIAIANQGRVARGGKTLNSPDNPRQTLQALYSLPARDFHRITSGYTGVSAHPGYNEVGGLGSPVANLLVPGLAAATVRSQQFRPTSLRSSGQ